MLTAKREFSVTGLRNHEYYFRRRGQKSFVGGQRAARGISGIAKRVNYESFGDLIRSL
jgi:hypothetical protein